MDPSLIRKVLLRTGVELYLLYMVVGLVAVLARNLTVGRQLPGLRWSYTRVLTVGGVLLLVFLVGSVFISPLLAKKPAWRTFTSEEGKFTVRFPGAPQEYEEEVDTEHSKAEAHSFVIPGGWIGVTYTVQYLDHPAGEKALTEKAAQTLEEMRDGTVRQMKSTLLSSSPITLGAHQGLEYTYRDPRGIGLIRSRLIISGTRVYHQWAGPLADAETDPCGREFFASFTLVEAAASPGATE